MPVQLFPNWVVKLVRSPNLQHRHWLDRPVEIFHVSPKMTKFEIKEYLVKLYQLPVRHVHTAIYEGKQRLNRTHMARFREPDYKKAYVYLHDGVDTNKPRYAQLEQMLTPEAQQAWPAKPHLDLPQLAKVAERGPTPPRRRNAVRQKPIKFRPYDSIFSDEEP